MKNTPDFIKNDGIGLLTALKFGLLSALIILFGCDQHESVKKVSLQPNYFQSERVDDVSIAEAVLNFGFDLRLDPKEDVRIYAPFVNYLTQKVDQRFTIRFTKGYEDTADNLGRGIIQFAALGPVNYVRAHEKYGVGCLVMGLNKQGRAEYRSIIVTRPDSPIVSIEDLRGKSFAFGDRLSTQGHLLPRRMLEESRISLENLNDYIFTGSHAETARLVINGRFDAGGLQDTLARKLESDGRIRVVAVSDPSPSSLICYNKDVDPAILKVVRAALLTFDPAGKDSKWLTNWDQTEMANGFIGMEEAALEEIRRMASEYGLLTL